MVALGNNLWLPVRLFPKLSTNSKLFSLSSSTAMSAGAPTFSVPLPRKTGKARGSVDGGARNHLIERHAQHQEFRHHVRKVDDLGGAAFRSPVGRESVRQEACLQHAIGDIPAQVAGAPIAQIEPDAAAAGGHHLRQNVPVVVDDAVGRRRKHVRDDIAGFEQREKLGQRRHGLAHVDHHGQLERRGHFLRAPEHLKIVRAGHVA